MNWYKKAQKTYWDFAHSPSKTKTNYLWAYINGVMEKSPITSPNDSHITAWPRKETGFRGRFDSKHNVVTIINPFNGFPIPNKILRDIYNNFGNDVKIREF